MTIPGKKMVRALGYSGLDAGRELEYFYKEHDVPTVCYGVALVMAEILKPDGGQAYVGPALRDLARAGFSPSTVFGAILTDVRDFLKLRYRCKGLSIGSAEAINLVTSASPDVEALGDHGADWVINLVVTALDVLSTGSGTPEEFGRFRPAVQGIRDLCRAADKAFGARREGRLGQYRDEMDDAAFGE